ncbi:PREDICTED: putative fatty acyl-CoA reductase CG8306 [Polistes dominula]|uniref:Fatty acyl-CoA reductase n=1 Tax=Polistes dominula TaxID=743375 RepID=A0ABM1J0I7_POLDO|nr:PREDICTED: putative fatty acyl-CoA reductase CG8306 [Polistes dominula]XP_015185972.1 PREDICTED: putative fatty acyl-CoA reductase CG8306 [Polistes dominula]XP_015185973.1 PREDICTED: putative fatty acyl-CoA reductase CG8306 [Polistes dominula]XP_015185974.1 PREDICTED: putative fatty acyl-CoA reductase CG8306 [Polistes dominula]
MGEPNIGLSEKDCELIKDTDLIFHSAASVRFMDNIRFIVNTNIRGTRDLLLLAQKMNNLKAFVYISTAYSQCVHNKIEEKFYKPPIKTDDIIKLTEILTEDQLHLITPKLLGEWPNTYVYTKAICEDTVRQYSNGIPTCIIRPSIVVSTAKEPIAGWINNLYGLTGVAFGAMMGVLHTLHCDDRVISDIVPVDYVVNNTIVAAWDVVQKESKPQNILISNGINKSMPVDEKIPVYNVVSSVQNRLTLFTLAEKIKSNGIQYPSEQVLWYYSLCLNRNYYVNFVWTILLHWIPAIILDSLTYLSGGKPILFKIYKKMGTFYNVISFFNTRDWEFTNDNVLKLWDKLSVVDKYNFFFDISDIDWECFFDIYMKGLRVYMLKDPMSTIEKGKLLNRKLKIIHFMVKISSSVLFLYICYSLLHLLFF